MTCQLNEQPPPLPNSCPIAVSARKQQVAKLVCMVWLHRQTPLDLVLTLFNLNQFGIVIMEIELKAKQWCIRNTLVVELIQVVHKHNLSNTNKNP